MKKQRAREAVRLQRETLWESYVELLGHLATKELTAREHDNNDL